MARTRARTKWEAAGPKIKNLIEDFPKEEPLGLGGLHNGGAFSGCKDFERDLGFEPPHADMDQESGQATNHFIEKTFSNNCDC